MSTHTSYARPPGGSKWRLLLEGDEARLGDIPAADVVALIQGAVRVVARAAEVIAGRQPGQVGRRGKAIENATRFRFVDTFAGSVGVLLRGPAPRIDDTSGLDLDDLRLTDMALISTLDSLSGRETDAYVARGLVELADQLGIGVRYVGVRLTVESDSIKTRSEVLDRSARTRLHRVAERSPEVATTAVIGTLVEADFENHTARLRTPSSRRVRVAFDEEQSDEVQQALRQQAELDGVVTYDDATRQVSSVELRAVRRTHQLGLDLDSGAFWRDATIAGLAEEQGVGPADLEALRDDTASPEELDRFFEALDL